MVWDISKATLAQEFSTATQDTSPEGLFFKPDGSKLYVVLDGSVGKLYEYNLGTNWDISSLTYLQTFTTGELAGVYFKSDGLKMYVSKYVSHDIAEYDLSVAWDISTAVFLQDFSVASDAPIPQEIFFSENGDYLFVMCPLYASVSTYYLITGWDISSAVFSKTLDVSTIESLPAGLFFKVDGTKMYIGGTSGLIHEYDLSSSFNISTAAFSKSLDVSSETTTMAGLFFKEDGTKMYASGNTSAKIYEYNLTASKKRPKKSS